MNKHAVCLSMPGSPRQRCTVRVSFLPSSVVPEMAVSISAACDIGISQPKSPPPIDGAQLTGAG
ncbi:hypothetical protein ACRE_043100 [Hapsidospora chrysogenum ATCC 11550]|uniref:Uncharacterized protein n=1 Tax=Hapsidospora chrysogenum (strain ATCC 11550 / CBS 779.69 / DSM 880 / IAM 14645 / JCM 23072 / IMI 49137) TaxID=857340 RepID=A0A086T6B2_HAPC1|nr:hypothetical protein ACRE_043100 [Hapsidospora chrysogenum ATCC 11550]